MPNVRGISLLDILPWSSDDAGFVPDAWIERLGVLTVVDHVATTSDDYHLHEGRLQSLGDALGWQSGNWPVRISGLTRGLPFRLAIQRGPVTGGQPAAPGNWTLDIRAVDVDVLIPGLVPALQAGGQGATPLHLVPAPAGPATPNGVRVAARGVVRITGGPGQAPAVQLADDPDPLDPEVPTGATLRVNTTPPDFLIGGSGFGMTVGDVTIDLSSQYTPEEARARGQDESWQGISFREFTVHTPKAFLGVDHLSIGAHDFLVALPNSPRRGLQGEVRVELGKDVADTYDLRVKLQAQKADGSLKPLPLAGIGTLTPVATLDATEDTDGRHQRVEATFDYSTVVGTTDMSVVQVVWQLPDGTRGISSPTPWFDAPPGSTLRYQLHVAKTGAEGEAAGPYAIPSNAVALAEVAVGFTAPDGEAPAGDPPPIYVTIDGVTCANVVHLRGTPADLVGLTLAAEGGVVGRWQLGGGSAPIVAPAAATFALPTLAPDLPAQDLTFTVPGGVRRVRIEAVAAGPLVVGHANPSTDPAMAEVSVFRTGDPAGQVAHPVPTSIVDTFEGAGYHRRGVRRPVAPGATPVVGGNAGAVQVPAAAMAEVEVLVPAHAGSPVPAVTVAQKIVPPGVQLFFGFDGTTVQKVARVVEVTKDMESANKPTSSGHLSIALPIALTARERRDGTTDDDAFGVGSARQRLTYWRQQLEARAADPAKLHYYVVARTDDLCYKASLAGNKDYNERLPKAPNDPGGLAARRLKAAKDELIAAGVKESQIAGRIETDPPPGDWPAELPPRFLDKRRLALWQYDEPVPPADLPEGAPVWNPQWSSDGPRLGVPKEIADHEAAKLDDRRVGYRCAEIYVLPLAAKAEAPPPPDASHPAGPVRVLVPGPDGQPAPPPVPSTVAKAGTDWRVRTRLKWDSPTYETLADAVPTEAELLVAWKPAEVEIPGESAPVTPTGPAHWEALLRWAYDVRTGRTDLTGSLALPEGAITLTSNFLAGALALGPAAAALVDEQKVVQQPGWQAVSFVALMGAGGVIGSLLNSKPESPKSTVDLDKFSFSYQWNGNTEIAATIDYTVDLKVNLDVDGLAQLTGAVQVRYKGVGVRIEADLEKDTPSLDRIALSYDDMRMEIVDAGSWSLDGPLGDLLRIGGMRVGSGSAWMEFDLDIAADLGVVTLDTATVRLSISGDTLTPELRGLTARVNLAEVVTGMGSISVGDGGAIDALLGLQVHPIKLGAYGALAIQQDFVSVEMGVQLPVGIPLGATGMGAFGFVGRFVANGTRNLDGLSTADMARRELDWYSTLPPTKKYKRQPGQYAVGLGAVVGTLPDGGFTFNAEGSLAVGFPDVSVVFGISAKLAAERKLAAMEQGSEAETKQATLLGIVAVEPEYVALAVRASYTVPSVLTLDVPISAYFPLQTTTDTWYVRIGSDGFDPAVQGPADGKPRPGEPVSIAIFPGRLDLRAWAFLMIEEGGIRRLGGQLVPIDIGEPLDFDGFAIGFGAGFTLAKKAGPLSVSLSAFLLVGLGTKPLLVAGAIGGRGELDLGIVSVSLEGYVKAIVTANSWMLEGKVCGKVDLYFFEVEGCVDFKIGSPAPLPEAPSPLRGMDLVDHLAAVKGSVAAGAGAPPVVWPDTIAVLKFAHFVEDTPDARKDFVRKLESPAPPSRWSGSTELKYAYRLTAVTLERQDPTTNAWAKVPGPFDSAWWLPTFRRGVVTGQDAQGPSEEEGRELGLFHFNGWAWARWLGEDAATLPGDPAQTVGEVCTPSPAPVPSCARGEEATLPGDALARFVAEPETEVAFPSRFRVRARLGATLTPGRLAALAGEAGWTYLPPAVRPLAGPAIVAGKPVTKGWRFPSLRQGTQFVATAPTTLRYSTPMHRGELTFECCAAPMFTPRPVSAVCDTMPAGTGPIASFTGSTGTLYSGPALVLAIHGTEPTVQVGTGGMRGDLPRLATRVTVDVMPRGGSARVQALGPGNSILAQAVTSGTTRQTLTVQAANIRAIRIDGVGGAPSVFRVCHTPAPTHPLGRLLDDATLEQPRVTVYDAADQGVVLAPVSPLALPAPSTPSLVGPSATSGGCGRLVYKLPPVPEQGPGAGGWVRVEVAAHRRGPISLISACGVTMQAVVAHAQDQGVRTSYVQLFEDLGAHLDPGSPKYNAPTRDVYLEPGTTYRIAVGWQYKVWTPANPGDTPPAKPDHAPSAWKTGTPEVFTFRTAEYGLTKPSAADKPIDETLMGDPSRGGPGFDERTFDPRGLARFLRATQPAVDGAPHFLDDEMGFRFDADHLEALVNRYGRTLKVRVLHTRPAPGTLHDAKPTPPGAEHVLDVAMNYEFSVTSDAWYDSDLRVRDAADGASTPCLASAPPLGSSKLAVSAELAPATEYDLVLSVVPAPLPPPDEKTIPAFPEVVVARTNFRTSRFRDAAGLLAGLGFGLGALQPPIDAIAVAPLGAAPGNGPIVSDDALDAALRTLGLDPWSLAAAPRTAAIWLPPATPQETQWRLAGVLLEADEPIHRDGLATGAKGEDAPKARVEVQSLAIHTVFDSGVPSLAPIASLTQRIRNASGTRVLLAPATPITLPDTDRLALQLVFAEHGKDGASGFMPLYDRPLVVFQEGE